MRNLGLIQWDGHHENAHTETCNQLAAVNTSEVLGRCMQGVAKTEDQRTQADGPVATEAISSDACHNSTEEGSAREDGHKSTAKGEA